MAKNQNKKGNKNADDIDNGVDESEEVEGAEEGQDELEGLDSPEAPQGPAAPVKGAKVHEKMVDVINNGNQDFHHAEHGPLKAKGFGTFPESHAKLLVRMGNGLVVTRDTANKQFEDAKKAAASQKDGGGATPGATGFEQNANNNTAFGAKTTQKLGYDA